MYEDKPPIGDPPDESNDFHGAIPKTKPRQCGAF